ncbi:MAG: FAD-dependent oxidoreductase [Streptosporangiales bacterium]|nr:FAD-dependent oxidoreductase [Streptosporangiales bacterium]
MGVADGRIAVVGGGIVGTAIAYQLAVRGHRDVLVVERGAIGEGSTAYATGGIRQQFSSRVNIELSRRAVAFYERFADEVGYPLDFRQHGYLFLLDSDAARQQLAAGVRLQHELGVPVQELSPAQVHDLFPQVRTDDLVAGVYCPTDGSASPADAVQGLWRAGRALGVTYRRHLEVGELVRSPQGEVRGVMAGGELIEATTVVVATGPSAAETGQRFGVELPVSPHRRQAFALAPVDWLSPSLPMTVDLATGAYVHPEASGGVIGGTDRDVPSGTDTSVDWDRLDRLVAALGHRIPALADASVARGWAGLREMSPDDHALVGPIDDIPGLWVAVGFSGHGFMHAPAIGDSVAAWLLDGTPTVDLTPLDPMRFRTGQPVGESVAF